MKKSINFAGYQGKISVHTKAIKKFISLIKKEFSCNFEEDITLKNNKASDLINLTRKGDVDISYLFSSYFLNLIPQLGIFDLPFYFKNKDEALNKLKNLSNLINNKFNEENNLVLLGFWDNGTRHISSAKSFIKTLNDCEGQIIRTTPNSLHIKSFKAFGFIPKPLDVLEFKKSLSNNELDAQENPLTNFYQFKVYNSHKFLTKTSHLFGFCLFIANKSFFDKLSNQEKNLILNTSKYINVFQKKLAAQEDKRLIEVIKKEKVLVSDLSFENRLNFIKQSEKIHRHFFSKFKN